MMLQSTASYLLLIAIQGYGGLVIIDNIHFQYNTWLFSIMIFSISFILQDQLILGALFYVILINLKHLFIYLVRIKSYNMIYRLLLIWHTI